MTRLLSVVYRLRWYLPFVPLIIVASAVFVGRSSGGNSTTASLIVGGLLVVMLVLAVVVFAANLAGVNPDAEHQAIRLHPNPMAQALLTRWLRRSRHFRYVGGAAGFALGVGIGGGSNAAAMFLSTLGGVAVGGALAEIHSLRGSDSVTTSASLVRRDATDYTDRRDALAVRVIGVSAVVLAGWSALFGSARSNVALLASLGAVVVALGTITVQRAVILRPRPALTDELRRADDLMRRLAGILGFTKPAIGVGLGLLALSVSSLGSNSVYGSTAMVLWLLAVGWNILRRQSPESIAAEMFT